MKRSKAEKSDRYRIIIGVSNDDSNNNNNNNSDNDSDLKVQYYCNHTSRDTQSNPIKKKNYNAGR